MANTITDISAYLEQIKSERYAKDMRTALYNAIKGVDNNAKLATDSSDIAEEAAANAKAAAEEVETLSNQLQRAIANYDAKIDASIEGSGIARYIKADFEDGLLLSATSLDTSFSCYVPKGTRLKMRVESSVHSWYLNVYGLINDRHKSIYTMTVSQPDSIHEFIVEEDFYGIAFAWSGGPQPGDGDELQIDLMLNDPSRFKTLVDYAMGVPSIEETLPNFGGSSDPSTSKDFKCNLLKGYEYSLSMDPKMGTTSEDYYDGYYVATVVLKSIHGTYTDLVTIPPEGLYNYKFTPTENISAIRFVISAMVSIENSTIQIVPIVSKSITAEVINSPVGSDVMISELDIHGSKDLMSRKFFMIADDHISQYDELYNAGAAARAHQLDGNYETFMPLYQLDNILVGNFRYTIFTELFTQTMFVEFYQYSPDGTSSLQRSGLIKIENGGSGIDVSDLDSLNAMRLIARNPSSGENSLPDLNEAKPNHLYLVYLTEGEANTITKQYIRRVGYYIYIPSTILPDGTDTPASHQIFFDLETNTFYSCIQSSDGVWSNWSKSSIKRDQLPPIASLLDDQEMNGLSLRRYTRWDPESVLDEEPDLDPMHYCPDSNNLYGYCRAIRFEDSNTTLNLDFNRSIKLYKGDTILLYTIPPATTNSNDSLYEKVPVIQYGIVVPTTGYYTNYQGNQNKGAPRVIYRSWNFLNSTWSMWAERIVEPQDICDKSIRANKLYNFDSSEDLETKVSGPLDSNMRIPNTQAVLNAIGGHTFEIGDVEETEAWDTSGQNLYHINGTYQLIGDYCHLTATVDKIPGWYDAYYSIPIPWVHQASAIAANDDNYIINTATEKNNYTVIRIAKVATISDRAMTNGQLHFTLVYKYR